MKLLYIEGPSWFITILLVLAAYGLGCLIGVFLLYA